MIEEIFKSEMKCRIFWWAKKWQVPLLDELLKHIVKDNQIIRNTYSKAKKRQLIAKTIAELKEDQIAYKFLKVRVGEILSNRQEFFDCYLGQAYRPTEEKYQ